MDKEYIERLVEIEQRSKSNGKRLNEHTERLDKLENTYSMLSQMDYRMGKIENAVERIDNKLESNSAQKGMKWDKLID